MISRKNNLEGSTRGTEENLGKPSISGLLLVFVTSVMPKEGKPPSDEHITVATFNPLPTAALCSLEKRGMGFAAKREA